MDSESVDDEVIVQTHDRVEADRKQEKPRRSLLLGIAAAAAMVGGVLLLPRNDASEAADQTVVNEMPLVIEALDPPAAPASEAEALAVAFVEAYGSFDVDRAISYLATNADLSAFGGNMGQVRLGNRMLEAQGFKLILASCEELSSSPAGTRVICWFDFHLIRSDEIGLGPYSGSRFDLFVLEGQIFSASMDWEYEEFGPQVWDPFHRWVAETYPTDAPIMYTGGGNPQFTEVSIGRWRQHSRGYASVVNAEMVELAESFMAARNAYDAETAMSLLSDDVVTVQLLSYNTLAPNMPQVRLSHDELALAFEAERLYRVRYEPFECREGAGGHVTCTYLMDSRLRQIEGYPPVESSFRLLIREGRIDLLSFPWLNASFPDNRPADIWGFVTWLQAEHPEAGGPMDDGELFQTLGQEVVLVLTRESIDLLASYLDEYERFVTR